MIEGLNTLVIIAETALIALVIGAGLGAEWAEEKRKKIESDTEEIKTEL